MIRLASFTLVVLLGCGTAQAQLAAPTTSADSARSRAVRPGKRTALPAPRVSGYMQVHYRFARATGTDSVVDNDNFRVQRVRIGVDGDITPRVSYQIEFDPRAPELTGVLRDAYATLHYIPRHDIRIGQQKTQFGYENRESSTDLFEVNRAEISDAIARGQNLRDIGVGLIGNIKLGKGVRFEDALTVVNGSGANVQADDTPRKNVWGRLGLRHRNDASNMLTRVGVSGGAGDFIERGDLLDPADDVRIEFVRKGADVEIDHPKFQLTAEYGTAKDENKSTAEIDEPVGYYLNLVGKFRPNYGPLLRYDVFDDTFKRWTFGAWWGAPAAPVRALLNYEARQLKDGVRGDDKVYLWLQVRY